MFETPSRYLYLVKVLTWHTKNISGRELNAPYIKDLLQFMFVFTRKASGFFNTLMSVFTHDASALFTIQRRKKSLHLLPVIIAATVGRLQRLLSLASSNPAQPFLELLFVSAPSARRHCRISSSALPRFQFFQLLKRVSLRWKG